MKILYLSSEVTPYAKTGGLADVAGTLPRVLGEAGLDVAVMMPKYRCVSNGGFRIVSTGLEFAVSVDSRTIPCSVDMTYLEKSKVPLYLLDCPHYFDRPGIYQESGRDYPDNLERYVFFCRAALEAAWRLDFCPDILHANDWQSALAPVYLRTTLAEDRFFQSCQTLLTIHNLAYQGNFPVEQYPLTGLNWDLFTIDGLEFYNSLNLLKGGLLFADRLTTVSKTYSEEIQTEAFGCGLEGVLQKRSNDLCGILNGVDYSIWDPATDEHIRKNYSADDFSGKIACKAALQEAFGLPVQPKTPILGVISRLADQKGIDLLIDMIDYLIAFDLQLVLLGTGDPEYHRIFQTMAKAYPEKLGVELAFNDPLAHEIEAGADIFLMPSRYEPCGLNQMYSLRYGTIPVVRAIGGLTDTVEPFDPQTGQGTGFHFTGPDAKEFFWAIKRALDLFQDKAKWNNMMQRAMRQDFSWQRSAKSYETLYKAMLKDRKKKL